MTLNTAVGVVVVGRNEGENLRVAIQSALAHRVPVVYVDSGSVDDSVEIARSTGIEVLPLDPAIPFTAPRAYNEGAERLQAIVPHIQFVQFLDGDAEFTPEWIPNAYKAMQQNLEVAVVCGRRRERHPQASVYNLIADVEWDTAIGFVDACGPESMMRLSMFQQVNGFDTTLIAGEEPEICFRIRQAGGKVLRIDADSAWHDMGMTSFWVWWKRSRRGGHAFAEEAWIHRHHPARYRFRECARIWLWAFILPIVALAPAPWTGGQSLWLLPIGYSLYLIKNYLWALKHRQYSPPKALTYAVFYLLMKFAKWHGQAEFLWLKLRNRRRGLMEYQEKKQVI